MSDDGNIEAPPHPKVPPGVPMAALAAGNDTPPPPPPPDEPEVLPPGSMPSQRRGKPKSETPLLDEAEHIAKGLGGLAGQVVKGAVRGAKTEVRKIKKAGKAAAHELIDKL